MYRFAEIVESVAQATIDCYVDSELSQSVVDEMRLDIRARFKKMFVKIGSPISDVAAEWLADEHLKLASPNGGKTLHALGFVSNVLDPKELKPNDLIMLRKLFPADVSIIGEKLMGF